MSPNRNGTLLWRATLILALVTGVALFGLYSSRLAPGSVADPAVSLRRADAEREAVSARAAVTVAHAAKARVATRTALARAESLRGRVRIVTSRQLVVQDSEPAKPTLVPVPPLVTERIRADSAAISALSMALVWDGRAMAVQDELLGAEARAGSAARLTIAELQRARSSRCGRRCGMMLGVLGVVALGVACDQARRLVRP